MSAKVCKETLDSLRQRRALLGAEWLPEQLEEILLLMPRKSTERDFRVCVFMFDCIRLGRLEGRSNEWLPSDDEIEGLCRVAEGK